jgi:hypothetical protein
MRNRLIRLSVRATLSVLAFCARRPALDVLTAALTKGLAIAIVKRKGIGQASSPEELGRLWQRAFPSKKQVPIESVVGNTVTAQIHTPCPLHGTGDVRACHRMMQFDREVVARAGGQFVVLQSQATPGRTFCRVVMRMKGESVADLVPAHEQGRESDVEGEQH